MNQNLMAVFMLACELGNVADYMGRTKGAAKYMKLVDLFDEVAAVGSIDWKQVVPAFKALDAAGRMELFAAIKAKIDLPDDKVEAKIEEGLGLMVEAYSIIERSIAFAKALKA